MNDTRISSLRQQLGWTQERLATESTVGIRTIQRIEAGHDASLETLSRVSSALGVSVRDLFTVLAHQDFSDRVEAMHLRAQLQQRARDRITSHWLSLYIAVGLVVTFISLLMGLWGGGPILVLVYAASGYPYLCTLRDRSLEPRLDRAYPLSHRTALTKPFAELPDGRRTTTSTRA